MGQTEYITKPGLLQYLLIPPEIEVTAVLPINQDILCVQWHYYKEAVQPSKMTNVVIAAFTTAQAQLKLFDCLRCVRRRSTVIQTAYFTLRSQVKLSFL